MANIPPQETPHPPFMVEPRPAEYETIVAALPDHTKAGPVGITAALRGAGGHGKTVLARAGRLPGWRAVGNPGRASQSAGANLHHRVSGWPHHRRKRGNPLEASTGKAVKINPMAAQQMAMFPQTNPLVDELKELDVNSLSPIEAPNKIYEWQRKFVSKDKKR